VSYLYSVTSHMIPGVPSGFPRAANCTRHSSHLGVITAPLSRSGQLQMAFPAGWQDCERFPCIHYSRGYRLMLFVCVSLELDLYSSAREMREQMVCTPATPRADNPRANLLPKTQQSSPLLSTIANSSSSNMQGVLVLRLSCVLLLFARHR
jgi:hypothetical protein